MKKFIAMVLSLSLWQTAIAQTPSTASLHELTKITHAEQLFYEQFTNGFVLSSTEMIVALIQKQRSLTPQQLNDVRAIIHEHMTSVAAELSTQIDFENQILPLYLEAYAKGYTQEEVDALIVFYQTPVGQNIALKTSKINQDAAEAALPIMRQYSADFIQSGKNQQEFINLGKKIDKRLAQSSK